MTDEDKSKEGNVEGTINAVTGLAKAVPVYEDAIQPAAKEIGKALGTVAKTVNVALAPVKGLVWGYEQIEEFVSSKVSEKLQNTPEEEIVTPKPNVAGPALESLRYTGHEESLRELYANLLAASMDSMTSARAHPGFVEILKQITPDEAKLLKLFTHHRPFPLLDVRQESTEAGKRGGRDILKSFSTLGEEAGCENANLTPSYLDNLSRLGLIEIPTFFEYTAPNVYDQLESHPTIESIKQQLNNLPNQQCQIQRRGAQVTQLGRQFINICVIDHAAKRPPKP
ncbi:DUF4393 domain-containing protein (plasmid) [Pseudoalteromonas lipolytica]|uniref:DUF4393 domain-containing protein n=1 Tax=Pseudoalteromonas lipolytica TaxID=570156 RepID=A0AAD0SB43_9GAMM|nr:DUF4393 domain-containing protein [Pseudoalteromonas donghaensis]AXV67616.1 DUF4393 domain-containing protein [Pseudoalteromonas donghaensis]